MGLIFVQRRDRKSPNKKINPKGQQIKRSKKRSTEKVNNFNDQTSSTWAHKKKDQKLSKKTNPEKKTQKLKKKSAKSPIW